jgi:hypothetical protein
LCQLAPSRITTAWASAATWLLALIHAEPGMARALMASSTEVLAGLVDRVTFLKRRAFFLDQPVSGSR